MPQEHQDKIIRASRAILNYCMARTDSIQDAEDLSQDILLELHKALPNLRDEKAFYGFMWAVADNVYKNWLRKKRKAAYVPLCENTAAPDPRENEDNSGDLNTLRRELALLHANHRKATVLYYMENKSCAQIASQLCISESMVKYLLFKSRQRIREGMFMERIYGEQSYRPKALQLNAWGGPSDTYSLSKSKLVQNILFACYNDALTPACISLELGVALPYLEDDLQRLLDAHLLQKKGDKYRTNIVIFTQAFNEEVERKTLDMQKRLARMVQNAITDKEKAIRALGFSGRDMPLPIFRWQMASILLHGAIIEKLQQRIQLTPPLQPNGHRFFVWGTETSPQFSDVDAFSCSISHVESSRNDTMQFMDYVLNGPMIHHIFFSRPSTLNVCAAIARKEALHSQNDQDDAANLVKLDYVKNQNGELSLNMPIFTRSQFERLHALVYQDTDAMAAEAAGMTDAVADILQNHVPAHISCNYRVMASLRLLRLGISAPMCMLYREGFLDKVDSQGMLHTTYFLLNE